MAKEKVILGIDTSCYTTSIAVMNLQGQLLADERQILEVKEGGCGLAQSEMVFQHTRNLPKLMNKINFADLKLCAVAATNKPRPLVDSYMPAFLTGFGLAQNLAQVLSLPLYALSHQENHLAAGLWSAKGPEEDRFLLLHGSGGTTDVLLVEGHLSNGVLLTLVGESVDLHAGQFVDRVGVSLGLSFPAGPSLEKLAQEADKHVLLRPWIKENKISFSGICSKAQRLAEAGTNKAELALGVEDALGRGFAKLLTNICQQHALQEVLLVGGVCSNAYVRQLLQELLAKKRINTFMPAPRYSGDGAVGAAYYGLTKVRSRMNGSGVEC